MHKHIVNLFCVLAIAFPVWAYGDVHTAATCSYADVNAAVAAASGGDTVSIPAGSCTWSSQLVITKGITLQGAGVGKTVITANTGSTHLVKYAPSSPALNEKFRLTGFEFDLVNTTPGWRLTNPSTSYPVTNIRLDHNKWKNCRSGAPFLTDGTLWGVVDHNSFVGQCHIDNYGTPSAGGITSWNTTTHTFGTKYNLYYENNTFDADYTVFTGGHGGRYVFRYNTVNLTSISLWPMLDAHGNQPQGVYGAMGVEVYGNLVNGNTRTARLLDQRGGMGLVFNNSVVNGTMGLQVREEYCDSVSATNYPDGQASNGEPQHVSSTYYWNNRDDGVLRHFSLTENGCSTYAIAANRDFWQDSRLISETFNGSQGTGCGPLSARPATCTTGVGYWATDQSCATISTGSVGASTTTPLSGTLYKCTSTNTWTPYYTPYTYPHPLVQGGGQTTVKVPASPANMKNTLKAN